MREIKFRIYDGSEMFYWGIGDVSGDGSSCTFPSGNLIKLQQMQYTGLKDKNGVEIYDGDIVYDHACKSTTIVEYKEIISEENFGDGIGFVGYNLDLYYGYPPTHAILEVIGNIYENKDLLN